MDKKQENEKEPEVFFCDICQESIADAEINRGQAVEIKGRLICGNCRARLVPPLKSARLGTIFAFLGLAGIGVVGWLGHLFTLEQARTISDLRSEFSKGLKDSMDSHQQGMGKLTGKLEGLDGKLVQAGKSWKVQAGLLGNGQEELKKIQGQSCRSLEQELALLSGRLTELDDRDRRRGDKIANLVAALHRKLEVSLTASGVPATGGGVEPGPGGGEEAPVPGGGAGQFTKLLQSPEANKRWNAIEQLEKLGGARAAGLIAGRLADEDLWVRRLAAEVLGRMAEKSVVGDLIKALEDQEFMVRGAAVASLRKLTGKKFSFDPHDSAALRKDAVRRWQIWWEREKGK